MKEKELINDFFIPFHGMSHPEDVHKGIGDDAAVVSVGGKLLAVSVDTMTEGVHFYSGIDPEDLGYRSIAAAISDMAAMSATPRYVTVSLSIQSIEQNWMEKFIEGIKACIVQYDCYLVGGDTVKGAMSIGVQVIGICESQPIYRNGAKENDLVAVTGFLGGAKTALSFLGHEDELSPDIKYVLQRYHRPSPRIDLAKKLNKYLNSAIDISDGLVSDIGHIASQSRKKISLIKEDVPIDPKILSLVTEETAAENALAGGDDYEIAFTFSRAYLNEVNKIGIAANVPITVIGTVEEGLGVNVMSKSGEVLDHHASQGFDHFMT